VRTRTSGILVLPVINRIEPLHPLDCPVTSQKLALGEESLRKSATHSQRNVCEISRSPRPLTDGVVRPKRLVIRVVDDFGRRPGLRSMVRDQIAKRPDLLFRFVISLLFFGLVYGGTAARAFAGNENPHATSLGPGLTFAIADFDGDCRPDFASIQAEENSSGSSDYSIQIQLSDVGRQSIHLVAPVGVLLIEARDVDGDSTVDLVVSTAWRKQPVAIFLNDGHGTFSRAELAAFPKAFSECEKNLVSGPDPATDALGALPQPAAGICPDENDSGFDRSPASLILASSAGFPTDSFLTSHSGRAPPSEIHAS
jgi:hypothetical protein